MHATSLPAAPTSGPQFDLPPIAPATQVAQRAAPFSQLLSQAQAAPPIPTPAAPPPQPPAQPKSNDAPRTNRNVSDGNGSSRSPSSASNQTNGDADSAKTSSSDGDDKSPDPNQQSTNSATGHAHAKPRAKADAKDARAGKKEGDSSPSPSAAQSSAENAATATAVLSAQSATKDGEAGKKQKGDDKASDSKGDNGSQTNDGTPNAGAQDAAAAVSAMAVAATSAVQDSKGDTKAKSDDTKQTTKPAAQVSTKTKPMAGFIPAASQSDANGEPSAEAVTTATTSRPHAKAGDAAVASIQATKNTPGTAAQSDGSAASATIAAAPPPPVAAAVTTVAASEVPVVSTITVDPSTTAPSPNAMENSAPPQPGSTPNYTAPNNAASAMPSAFAATMAQNGVANPAGGGLNTIDRARFVQRVASAFQVAGDQGGQIRLRLSPPELGSLQMQISVKQGVLSATIQADNSTTQQVLLDSLPDLRDRLAQQDIRIDRFDVELMGQGSGGMPQPQGNPDFDQSGRRQTPTSNTIASPASMETSRLPVSAAVSTNGALNIIV